MNEIFRGQLLSEAIRIGDNLIEQGIWHKEGISWKTVNGQFEQVTWEEHSHLYGGTCGIVWFLLELYRQTGQEKYFSIAYKGLKWAEAFQSNNQVNRFSLLTGNLSVPFTQLAFYRTTGEQSFVYSALQAIRNYEKFISQPTIYEYLNGFSGTILGLLHLHSVAPEDWLLQFIDSCVGILIEQVNIGKQGIYWDRSHKYIRGLCGFSHGASGIGYVFLELGHYLGNDSFFLLAEQAFTYEDQFWNLSQKNWVDFRKDFANSKEEENFRNAYTSGDLAFFKDGKFMNAWCHGAAGIGLSRLRAYELLKKNEYYFQAQQALETNRQTEEQRHILSSFTLCHGGGGNAEFFLEAYRVTGVNTYLELAEAIAMKALNSNQRYGYYRTGTMHPIEDNSLFMGNAGIGYFYLRLIDPLHTFSILAPRIDNTLQDKLSLQAYPILSTSKQKIQQLLIKGKFPYTVSLLETMLPVLNINHLFKECLEKSLIFQQTLIDFIKINTENNITEFQASVIKETFRIEQLQNTLNNSIISDALLHYYSRMKFNDAQRINNLSEAIFAQQRLLLDPSIILIQTKLNCFNNEILNFFEENLIEDSFLILISTTQKVILRQLTHFAYTVLIAFTEATSVETVIENILRQFEASSENQLEQSKRLINEQIKALIASGLLIDSTQHPLCHLITSLNPTDLDKSTDIII